MSVEIASLSISFHAWSMNSRLPKSGFGRGGQAFWWRGACEWFASVSRPIGAKIAQILRARNANCSLYCASPCCSGHGTALPMNQSALSRDAPQQLAPEFQHRSNTVKSGWFPDSQFCSSSTFACLLVSISERLTMATKRWRVSVQLHAVYHLFCFAINSGTRARPFIYRCYGVLTSPYHPQSPALARSRSYADEQPLPHQQPTQSCHSRVPQGLQLHLTTFG